MPTKQKPKATPPLKSQTKLLISLAVLIVLMFVMAATIAVLFIDKRT